MDEDMAAPNNNSDRKKNETTIVGDGDNSSGSFKDVTSASPGPESQAGFGEAGCQNTPPSANGVDVMYQQNGAHMSSAESDKSSNKSGSTNKKKNKLSLDQNYLTAPNSSNGKDSFDLSKNCSKESIFSAASDHKSFGNSPSPKLPTKNEARKSTSAGPGSANQEKNVIQVAASQLKNFLAPNYKTRNDEFKRYFKVPDSERFIIDYSCAYQREILVHGRMYLSQNWMCFYANIFKWETTLTIPMKDITKISKERTAKVIPNAIQICTKSDEKLFFTSFATRDKTHMVIFRLWQSSLLDQYEQPADLWAWAQHGYNEADLSESQDDLDDDAGSVLTDNSGGGGSKGCDFQICTTSNGSKQIIGQIPRVGSSKTEFTVAQAVSDDVEDSENDTVARQRPRPSPRHKRKKNKVYNANSPLLLNTPAVLPASLDDYSESSGDESSEVQCNCAGHDGKEMINEIFPISVDQMFLLLFTDSVFFRQLQELRKTTNLNLNEWHTDKSSGVKSRQVSYTVALNHSMGPKSCGVTEKQICAQCSKNGRVYVVKCEVQNIGVPYADTFYVVTTYCMSKVGSNQCRLRVHGGVAYKKSCWGIVKSFIEKNALVGIQDYFTDLSTQLRTECDRLGLTEQSNDRVGDSHKPSAKSQRKSDASFSPTISKKPASIVFPLIPSEIESLTKAILLILILMLLLNAMLFYKLWYFEAQSERISFESTLYDLQKLLQKPELSSAEWMRLFQQERIVHRKQSSKWADSLQDTLSAVEQIESSLKDLRKQMGSIRTEFLNSRHSSTYDEESPPTEQIKEEKTSRKKPLRDYSGL